MRKYMVDGEGSASTMGGRDIVVEDTKGFECARHYRSESLCDERESGI